MVRQIFWLERGIHPELISKDAIIPQERKKTQTFRESILKFVPARGEHCFLSYTLGFEHGPGIKRDGKGHNRKSQ